MFCPFQSLILLQRLCFKLVHFAFQKSDLLSKQVFLLRRHLWRGVVLLLLFGHHIIRHWWEWPVLVRVECGGDRIWLCWEKVMLTWTSMQPRWQNHRLLLDLFLRSIWLTLLLNLSMEACDLILHLGENLLVGLTLTWVIVLHRIQAVVEHILCLLDLRELLFKLLVFNGELYFCWLVFVGFPIWLGSNIVLLVHAILSLMQVVISWE